MRRCPSESEGRIDVNVISALVPEMDEQPVTRIQRKLAIGSGHVSHIEETPLACSSDEVTKITSGGKCIFLASPNNESFGVHRLH